MSNPKQRPTKETAVSMTAVALEIVQSLVNEIRPRGINMSGQLAIDHPKCGKFPLFIFCRHDGRYMFWFIEDGRYKLYVLGFEGMEEKIFDFNEHEMDQFQAKLREIQSDLDPT